MPAIVHFRASHTNSLGAPTFPVLNRVEEVVMRHTMLMAAALGLLIALGGCTTYSNYGYGYGYSYPTGYYAPYPNSYTYEYRPFYAPNYSGYFTEPTSRGGNG